MRNDPGEANPGQRPEAAPARTDARRNRDRLLAAAEAEFRRDPHASLEQVASAAGVVRSTLYRHFSNRDELRAAVSALRDKVVKQAAEQRSDVRLGPSPGEGGVVRPSPPGARDLEEAGLAEVRPPGQLGHEIPVVVDATHVLNEVPPHLVGEQLVAEAQRIAGVPVALYVIDVDGSYLRRLAGSSEFPATLEGPLSVGPEIAPDALPELYARLEAVLPECRPYPLWLRGRAIGVLLAVRRPRESLGEVARQGTAALELAGLYTDVLEVTRRRRETSPAAEVQLNLLPPRTVQIAGGELAGSLLPSYEIAGDWFDYVENPDGTWLALAETVGQGLMASALGSVALGALRATRRTGGTLEEAVASMDRVAREVGGDDFHMCVVVARWHAPTSRFSWVACGRLAPLLWARDGSHRQLVGRGYRPLGRTRSDRTFERRERRLFPGERVVLCSEGVSERTTASGGVLGLEGIARAVEQAVDRGAAATVRYIQEAVTAASDEPLDDDATVVVLAVQ
jgi:serine phosphatase RsbU (regulator of sigma subunit)